MSDRARALVDAFYKRPLSEYRRVVLEVRHTGGLDPGEIAFIHRRVDPVDADLITRHATAADDGETEH